VDVGRRVWAVVTVAVAAEDRVAREVLRVRPPNLVFKRQTKQPMVCLCGSVNLGGVRCVSTCLTSFHGARSPRGL